MRKYREKSPQNGGYTGKGKQRRSKKRPYKGALFFIVIREFKNNGKR
jgi:hypothetical protein